MNVKVKIHWDDEAEVWVAICDKLGIALESGSYDALIEKVRVAISEMVELNGISNIKSVVITKEEKYYVATDIASDVASQGLTVESALSNLKEALELYYEDGLL